MVSAPLPIGYIFPISSHRLANICMSWNKNADRAMCFLIMQSWRAHPEEGFFVFLCKCDNLRFSTWALASGFPPVFRLIILYISQIRKSFSLTQWLSPKIYVIETVGKAQVWPAYPIFEQ